MRLHLIFKGFLFFFFLQGFSQENISQRKEYTTIRIENPPKIDGILDEDIWNTADVAQNFVMVEPGDGDPIPQELQTTVKIVYDNEAIYIAAEMLESEPEKTIRQFTQRDNLQQSEFFGVDFNTYDDGENQTRFIVTSAGTQADARMTGDNEDYDYNLVWESSTYHDQRGWYVEMKIPYAALRFPEKKEQVWGLQFFRTITHRNQTYVWNYIDKSIGQVTQYTGLLKGIENIDPPVRLSLYPYTSIAANQYQDETSVNFNAGMDLKYGINDSFTLDLTLVPDFGQTAYDEVELNLGPFEQVFGENRAFFTEGTELFNKGNLFYSRRVGSTPIGFSSAQAAKLEDEEIIDNPEKTDLLNALKISGRTDRGLGIGLFNAVTNQTEAVYRNLNTGETRKMITEPYANYNIVVLDQRFNKNSSISLINTNVTRNGHFRDGNVTGFLFDVYNKENSFNFEGQAKMSNVNLPGQNLTGFASYFSARRTKGNIRYRLSHRLANKTYDINDLGINFMNNYNNISANVSYQIFEPKGNYNNYRIGLYGQHRRRYQPDITVNSEIGADFFAMTKERFAFGGGAEISSKFKDYFETRTPDTYINYDPSVSGRFFISSDYRKKFALDVRLRTAQYFESDFAYYNLNFSPRVRVNNKFNIIYRLSYGNQKDRPSFVNRIDGDIIFGIRDQKSLENSIQGNYSFTTKQGLNLSLRQFWSTASFKPETYSKLSANGERATITYDLEKNPNPDTNFNIWNLDLSYRWQFAPGSEAVLLYRNSIFNQDDLSELGYYDSLNNLFEQDARHNLSLRIVYFLDYNRVKNLFHS